MEGVISRSAGSAGRFDVTQGQDSTAVGCHTEVFWDSRCDGASVKTGSLAFSHFSIMVERHEMNAWDLMLCLCRTGKNKKEKGGHIVLHSKTGADG